MTSLSWRIANPKGTILFYDEWTAWKMFEAILHKTYDALDKGKRKR